MTDALAVVEQNQLEQLEERISAGLQTFVEVGSALMEIRDKKLYRQWHTTFEDYCRERWGMERRYAYRLIDAAEVVQNVSRGTHSLPASERQARPLTRLEPGRQAEAWGEAVATAPNGRVTAAHVEEVAHRYTETLAPPAPKPHVSYNSGNNEWYTPAEYIDAARAVMGDIDLDPASSHEANRVVRAAKLYTVEDDGLVHPWWGKVWLNPPYAGHLVGLFADKLTLHILAGDVTEAIILVNNATETVWFNKLVEVSSAVLFHRGRIRFWQPEGEPGAPLQGQAILYSGDNPRLFLKEFNKFGWGATL